MEDNKLINSKETEIKVSKSISVKQDNTKVSKKNKEDALIVGNVRNSDVNLEEKVTMNEDKDDIQLEKDYSQVKSELKYLFIEQIFMQKYSASNYEIPETLFNLIEIPAFGNCFYMCISYFLYHNINEHLSVRESVFNYVENHREEFYIFFNGNDNDELNNYTPDELLENYIENHKIEGTFAGEVEYTSICKLYQLRIIIFEQGFVVYNIFNIFTDDDYDPKNYGNVFILFINNNHFQYLEFKNKLNSENDIDANLDNLIAINLEERKKIRKKEFPISLKWTPEIYKEIYNFYKFNIIPTERLSKTSNPSQYTIRFKELALKNFYFENDRLYYIKESKTERLDNGNFLDKDKVIIKKIPYIFEVLPIINRIHNENGHISAKTLARKFMDGNNYLDGIELITEEFSKQCAECYTKFFSKKLVKSPKIIVDEGPHYRMLVDITYLDKKLFKDKTDYKYVIDSIDHFSKFYWGFLIRDKTSDTVLRKIKSFIAINKKPAIIQTDNGLEFKNQMISDYLEKENIKHVYSRPHHPQTNGCLERYHSELHKFMENYLLNIGEFNNQNIENALEEYIMLHNSTVKSSTKFAPEVIRDITDPELPQIFIKHTL